VKRIYRFMIYSGLVRLFLFAFSIHLAGTSLLLGQQPPQTPAPKPAPAKPANPFETVPTAPTEAPKPAPAKPGLTTPAVAPGAVDDVIELIEFRGARRVPQDTLRAMIFSKKGDKIDEDALHRDFMALWNTGRFDDIRARTGAWTHRVHHSVCRRRAPYRSLDSLRGRQVVTVSEILDRFKERRVGLPSSQQYDPNKVQRAGGRAEGISRRARPPVRHGGAGNPADSPVVDWKSSLSVDEGPKVKVGSINLEGNKVFSDPWCAAPCGVCVPWVFRGRFCSKPVLQDLRLQPSSNKTSRCS
jgi:outer membrane protein insertion porin family